MFFRVKQERHIRIWDKGKSEEPWTWQRALVVVRIVYTRRVWYSSCARPRKPAETGIEERTEFMETHFENLAQAQSGMARERVLQDLGPEATDIVLPKRRFSAFFKTDLDQTLRTCGLDTVAIGGINSHVCVMATALDAICHDFYTVLLEDLCAAYRRDIHENAMNAHRSSSLSPLFRVMTSDQFLEACGHAKEV